MTKFSSQEEQSIVYSAEEALRSILDMAFFSESEVTYEAYGSLFTIPLERKFADVPSMQTYADRLLNLKWVKKRWPEEAAVPLIVREKRGGYRNRASHRMEDGVGIIVIPPHLEGGRPSWAMREHVLLHEISHHFAKGVHGEDFIATLVEFLGNLIGPQVGLLYQIEVSKAQQEVLARREG